jgi:hypothetical protein
VPHDPQHKKLADLARLLQGRKVALVGDSMLQQTVDSMECEAQRRKLKTDCDGSFLEAMRECGAKAPLALAAPGQTQPAQFFYRGDRVYKSDEVCAVQRSTSPACSVRVRVSMDEEGSLPCPSQA